MAAPTEKKGENGPGDKIDEKTEETSKSPSFVIIQEMVKQPLLYNGRKFTVHSFVLIVKAFDTAAFYVHADPLARLATEQFTAKDLHGQSSNYTSYLSQKDGKWRFTQEMSFGRTVKGNCMQAKDMDTFFMKSKFFLDNGYSFTVDLLHKIKGSILVVLDSVAPLLFVDSRIGFELLEFVHLADQHLHPYLLEVKRDPLFNCQHPMELTLTDKLIDDCLK